jgi:hypothetical protein
LTAGEFGYDRTTDFDTNTNYLSHYGPSSENQKAHRQSNSMINDKIASKSRAGFIMRNSENEKVRSSKHSDTTFSYKAPKEYLKFSMKHKPRMYQEIKPVKAGAFSSFCGDSNKKVESKYSDRITLSARQMSRYETANEVKIQDDIPSQQTNNGLYSTRDHITQDDCQSARGPYIGVSSKAQSRLKSSRDSISHDLFKKPKVFSIEMLEKAIRDVGNNKIQYEIEIPFQNLNANNQLSDLLNIPSSKGSSNNTPLNLESSLLCEDSEVAKELNFFLEDFPKTLIEDKSE